MAFDVGVTGKSLLIVVVVLLTLFFAMFAPSLIAVGGIFVALAVLAWIVWLIGVGLNRRAKRFFGGGGRGR